MLNNLASTLTHINPLVVIYLLIALAVRLPVPFMHYLQLVSPLFKHLSYLGEVRRRFAQALTFLLQVTFCNLKNAEKLSQVAQRLAKFGLQVLLLFHREYSCIKFGEDLSELDVVEFLY